MSAPANRRYDGKTALITGGTTGIGLATALHLQEQGVRMIVTGQSKSSAENARTQLGSTATVVISDAGSLDDLASLTAMIENDFAPLDLVHLNAGISHTESFAEMTPERYDRIMAVNARGPYFALQKLAPYVRSGGAFVLTTSGSAELGLLHDTAYAASKAALRSMARTFARELASHGIRVNAVSPGPIDTQILERTRTAGQAAAIREHIRSTNPLGRLGTASEIGLAVGFLAFEATFTTGASLDVDWGATTL